LDNKLILELTAILVLVLANGFFALAEFSLIASRLSKLSQKKRQKKMGAEQALNLRKDQEGFLASVQVGITLVGVMLGVFSGATIVAKLEIILEKSTINFIAESATSISFVTVVLIITALSVVLGELVPKYIALSFPERYARLVAVPITFFIKITGIFSKLLSSIAGGLVRLIGIRKRQENEQITEDEINQMILEGSRSGVFEEEEHQFVRSVFEFTDSTVRRAMTPRTDVIGIAKDCSPDEVVKVIVRDGYSRYPVYDQIIDKVIGIIYTKDLITESESLNNVDISKIIREPFFVPDSLPLPKLLKDFQKGKIHLAVVLDEFGGTAGIITLEDVLEELVGEIQDEYDTEAAPLVKHSDTIVYADGDVWPGDINEMLDSHLPEDNVDTLAGLILEKTGYVPVKKETIVIADIRLTVLAKDENRILRLKAEKFSTNTAMDNQQ